jgi:hypothetical protein
MPMQVSHRGFVCLILFLPISVAGCQKGPTMYQVRGKVTYTGGTAPKAGVKVVSFLPIKGGSGEKRRPASGPIAPDGTFEMFTRVNGDGVDPGDYAVTFNIAKAPMDPTPMIPLKYTDINSPPYKITVDHKITDLDYTIDMSGGAAPATKTGG